MRIAHVSDVYLPRLGGVELQVHDLAARQREAGEDAFVLTTTGSGAAVGEVPMLRLGRQSGRGPYRLVSDRELADALFRCGTQVVHAHVSTFSPLAWRAARLALATGLPTVVSVHSMWHDVMPMMRRYTRWHAAAAWPVTWAAVSSAAAVAVREALDGTAVAVLPNGIDPAAWRTPVRQPTSDVPTLISVMRMARRKRPGALVDILLALHREYPGRFRAVLVGDGPQLPRLRRRINSAGQESLIRLTGALDRPAIRTLLAASDLYVAPARRESFGIAALEARSAGLPVLAHAGSGIADFVRPGVDGWLADSDEDLGDVLARLLTDPERLDAVARHNHAHEPPVNWQVVLEAAAALYETAARGRVRALPLDIGPPR